MKRSGVADLPLHGGRAPQWLAERITRLGTAITESIVTGIGDCETYRTKRQAEITAACSLFTICSILFTIYDLIRRSIAVDI